MTLDQLSNLIKDPKLFGILIVRPFGLLLQWLYSIVQNYGIAVILFALLVKLVCIPLTIKSKKSMLAMSAMNAELQQLQKKYANNRVKLNEEMQKLYEKHGVSPMSGCLPNLIPLPIMMGLYYAVQQPLQYIVGLSRETVIALAQMIGLDQFAGANYTVQIKIAEKLNAFVDGSGHFSDAVTNCLQSGETIFPLDFHFFGLNLADTPSICHPSIIWIIPILSGLTAFLSSYIMQKMQGTQNSAAAGQMKMLNFMMPLMSLYFAFILRVRSASTGSSTTYLPAYRRSSSPRRSAASRRPSRLLRLPASRQRSRPSVKHTRLHRSSSPRTQRTKRGTSKSCRSF